MLSIKTILVPLDFSETSTAALDYARELARMSGASLHLLSVVQDPFTQPWAAEAYGTSVPDVRERFVAVAKDQLAAALSDADRKTFRVTLATRVGAPAPEIVDYAKANGVDLIVMGTHGHGAIVHALIGSVAERVVRTATCPVLTIHKSA
jgi:nucleotide-binding universal stress UspA family protein